MEAQSGKRKPVFKWLGLILGGMMLLTGCLMLLGGGVCAVTNAFFSVSNGLGGYGAVSAVLLAVSCAAAVAGWFAIKFPGFRFAGQKESAEKTRYPADGESNE